MPPLRSLYLSILQRTSSRKIGYVPASASDPDSMSDSQYGEVKVSSHTTRRRRRIFLVLALAGVVLLSLAYFSSSSVGKESQQEKINKEWQEIEDMTHWRDTSKTTKKSDYYVLKSLGSDPTFTSPSKPEGPFIPIVPTRNVYGDSRPRTPLFISFGRNYKMLEQVVLGYIAIGWPREDIIVLDNSGTMNANKRKILSRNNPFFLDYEKLTERYGVSVFRTPTLLNFAQMQNFLTSIALEAGWSYFFWSHMDIVPLTEEEEIPYKSAYARIVEDLEEHLRYWNQTDKLKYATRPDVPYKLHSSKERKNIMKGKGINVNLKHPDDIKLTNWGHRYYMNDWLSLINTEAMEQVGSWDPFIPYYTTDCDFLGRMKMSGLEVTHGHIGTIFDVATRLPDVEADLFPTDPSEEANSPRYQETRKKLEEMMRKKQSGFRNTWQSEMKGGLGEPWTYNPRAFETAWRDQNDCGGKIYDKKWGFGAASPRNGCKLVDAGKRLGDMWAH